MSFQVQVLASFLGTLFGFLFAIVLHVITNFIQRKWAKEVFKKHLRREFEYDMRLLQDWFDKIEEILRKISAKDKRIYQYLKYSDFTRYFMDESFKFGLIYDLFNDDEVFGLNKLVTHGSLGMEQYVNSKVLEWKNCPAAEEDTKQKEILVFFEYEKNQLRDFKKLLAVLLGKLKK